MSLKNRDEHNRWRSKTVAFRVSPEEDAQIERYVQLSGLTKQDYITRRLTHKDVVVYGNPRVFKALRNQLAEVLLELQRIETGGAVNDMAEAEGVTEQLKADNQMEWVGRMNNIRNRAMEIVNNELIYAREPAARISTSETLEPPKVFWKYYDLFQRKRISLSEYAAATGLSAFAIRHFLKNVVEKSPKAIEKLKQI